MNLLRLMRWALVLGALAGCALPDTRPETFGPRREKTVYLAAKEAHATDEQRRLILTAYDETGVQLKRVQGEAQAVLSEWHGLDRRAPGFTAQAQVLAERWAALHREQLVAEADFDRAVAAALDEAQWKSWSDFMHEEDRRLRALTVDDAGPPAGRRR
ncbi:MAG TPA: hypothetical protein VM074_11165 [Solimonas sp.]|nr:hypothetical protein [Solimonas sp.]